MNRATIAITVDQHTVMARVPRSFVENTLMPEFEEMNRALIDHWSA